MIETIQPLVTFALFAYNQEKYIREAIGGALAQTYSPLEIILSDDFSTDRTFEIMQEMVATYSGPHSIRLNRNPENLGIAKHLNLIMTLVQSDFVVVAAGDDVSLSCRTERLVSAWLNSGRKMKSIHSYAADMNEAGKLTGSIRRGSEDRDLSSLFVHATLNVDVLGATQAWDMSLVRQFNPFLALVVNEDVVLPARASLVGGILFVSETLVNYRVGVGVSHEISRLQASGDNVVPISVRKRPYYLFLQKFRDFKEYGVLPKYISLFRCSRAMALYPIWLRSGFMSKTKLIFFMRRCSIKYLIRELIIIKLPALVVARRNIKLKMTNLPRD